MSPRRPPASKTIPLPFYSPLSGYCEAKPASAPGLEELKGAEAEALELHRAVLRARALLAFRDVTLDGLLLKIGKAARLDEAQEPALRVIALLFDRKTPSEMARPTGTEFGKELADAEPGPIPFIFLREAQ